MISKDNAEHYVWGPGCDGWHLVRNKQLSVIHERMDPGASEVLHFHREARQFFFVLHGALAVEIDGRREVIYAHQGVEIPPGTPHQVSNLSNDMVEFLVISQPQNQDDRVLVIP